MADNIIWACPKCKAQANEHGKGSCEGRDYFCLGFICECEGDQEPDHGGTYSNPCPNANCYHCGWGGKFPKPPGKILPWEKKALEAGWTPPAGWGKKE